MNVELEKSDNKGHGLDAGSRLSLVKFSLEYLLNRGSSQKEILGMINDKSIVPSALMAYNQDKKYMKGQGFSEEQIHEFGADLGAYSSVYNPSDKDLFEMLKPANPIQDETIDQAVNRPSLFERIGRFANSPRGRVAASLIMLVPGAYMLKNAQNAFAETYNDSWNHWSPADFNMDFVVDINDLLEFSDDWLSPGTISTVDYAGTDTNRDGIVNMRDFAKFAEEWGRSYTGNSRMSVFTSEATSVPGDQNHPYKRTYIGFENKSPINPDYEMDEVIFGVGTFHGINSQSYPEGWQSDYTSDPCQIRDWTTTPLYYIDPESYQNGFFLAIHDDPCSVVFKEGKVNANTKLDEPFNYVTVRFPVLKD